MIDQGDGDFAVKLLKVLGWFSGIVVSIWAAVKIISGRLSRRPSPEQDLVSVLSHDLLNQIAIDSKALTEKIHTLETRVSVLEAEINRRR